MKRRRLHRIRARLDAIDVALLSALTVGAVFLAWALWQLWLVFSSAL